MKVKNKQKDFRVSVLIVKMLRERSFEVARNCRMRALLRRGNMNERNYQSHGAKIRIDTYFWIQLTCKQNGVPIEKVS